MSDMYGIYEWDISRLHAARLGSAVGTLEIIRNHSNVPTRDSYPANSFQVHRLLLCLISKTPSSTSIIQRPGERPSSLLSNIMTICATERSFHMHGRGTRHRSA
ncbi:hypothetical protein ABKN59_000900 [Abortiporus biennis]